jgi:hypothetical protein
VKDLFQHFGNFAYCRQDFDFSWCMDTLFFAGEAIVLICGFVIIGCAVAGIGAHVLERRKK